MVFFMSRFDARKGIYRRGQVEWALWKFSTLDLPRGDEPLSTFRARVKHLLQIDRSGRGRGHPADPPPVEYALSSGGTEGTGVDATFTAFDAFCLAIAIDLLRAGFKQSEVFLFMIHLRQRLEGPFAEILRAPPTFRSRLAKNAVAEIGKEEPRDDRRVFLVIQRVEFSETFPAFPDMTFKRREPPILPDPFFCYGVDDLRDKLDTMDHIFRRAIVIEIAHMAAMIAELLKQAPVRRRGRPLQRV
jgi:hypothetical protein